MADEQNFSYWPVKKNTNDSRTYDNIQGQGDDYAAGYLLDHSSFKKHYKMIAIDLSKQ